MNLLLKNIAIGTFLLSITLAMCGSISYVLAGNCDTASPPRVDIEIAQSEIQEAYDITAADIQRLAEATGKRPFWPGLGASSADIAYDAEINENAAKERDGSYCATPAYVHVVIALRNRILHLAQELKEKPCLERVQRERLQKLAHADGQALAEFPIETEMRSLLGQLRPSQAKSVLAAKAQVTTAVREKIRALLDKIQDHAAEIGRRINAPEEIDRLQRQMEANQSCR
jgi:hypothetical protein